MVLAVGLLAVRLLLDAHWMCRTCLWMQGAFLDSEAVNKSSSNLSADELLELLNTDKTFQDKAQSGVVTDKVCVLLPHVVVGLHRV